MDFYITEEVDSGPSDLRRALNTKLDALRGEMIAELRNYIDSIERTNRSNTHEPDFTRGFLFLKQSRSLNRKANYLLAQELLSDLNNRYASHEISERFHPFRLYNRRNDLIVANKINETAGYKKRDIHSGALNRVIKHAQTAKKLEIAVKKIEDSRIQLIVELDKYAKRTRRSISERKEGAKDPNCCFRGIEKCYITLKHDFIFFKNSRRSNQEANRYLALKLIDKLRGDESIASIFDSSKLEDQRNQLIEKHGIHKAPGFKKHDIHSSELNRIIGHAKTIAKEADELLEDMRCEQNIGFAHIR